MELEVTSRCEGRSTVVAAQGEIDLTSCVRLRDTLDRVEDTDSDGVVVDLTKVGFIDSTGLSVLVDGARHARARDRSFGVVAHGHLRELLRITGLDTVMDVHRRLGDALPATTGAPGSSGSSTNGSPVNDEAPRT